MSETISLTALVPICFISDSGIWTSPTKCRFEWCRECARDANVI